MMINNKELQKAFRLVKIRLLGKNSILSSLPEMLSQAEAVTRQNGLSA